MRFVEEQTPMSQSMVDSPSPAPLVDLGRADNRNHTEDARPLQEVIARRVSQRARRRLFVAMLPLLLVSAVLAYMLAYYGM